MSKSLVLISPDGGDTPVPRLAEILKKLPELKSFHWTIGGDIIGMGSIPPTEMTFDQLCKLENERVELYEVHIHGFRTPPSDIVADEAKQAEVASITLIFADGDTWSVSSTDTNLLCLVSDRFKPFLLKDWDELNS